MRLDPGIEAFAGSDEDVTLLGVDEEAAIEAFRDRVYSREDTWIQELLCNARDAWRERRSKELDLPFGVQLGIDHDQGTVTVKDNGPGMDRELLLEVFRVLGHSTRRDSNEYTGAWGIGSKAPLKVVDAFTLKTRSRKDRMEHEVLVGRISVGGQARWGMKILCSKPCNGDWGTTVTVTPPPRLLEAVLERAKACTRHWDHPVHVTTRQGGQATTEAVGAVDVHGEAVLQASGEHWRASLVPKKPHERLPGLVVVDGIPYDLTHGRYSSWSHPWRLVIEYKIPSMVDLTTGRESLNLTQKTQDAIEQAIRCLHDAAAARYIDALDALGRFDDADAPALQGPAQDLDRMRHWLGRALSQSPHEVEHELHGSVLVQKVGATGTTTRSPIKHPIRTLFSGRLVCTGPSYARAEVEALLEEAKRPDRLQHVPGMHKFQPLVFVREPLGTPLSEMLVRRGARIVRRAKAIGLRFYYWRPGTGRQECIGEAQVPDGCFVVLQRLSDLARLVHHGNAVFLVRPAKRIQQALKAMGRRVVSRDQYVQELGQLMLCTSRGAMPAASVAAKVSVAYVHACPNNVLQQLPGLVVRATPDQLRILAILGLQRANPIGDTVGPGPGSLTETLARSSPIAPALWRRLKPRSDYWWSALDHYDQSLDADIAAANAFLDGCT